MCGFSINYYMLPQEIEIKLDLQNRENYLRLIEYLEIRSEASRQDNYFYDSDDWILSKNGWALRLRIEKGQSSLSLKGKTSESANGLAVRTEIEKTISDEVAQNYIREGLNLEGISNKLSDTIKPILKTDLLTRKLHFINYRHRATYSSHKLELIFEVDRTEFENGATEFELEIELKDRLAYKMVFDNVKLLLESLQIETIIQRESKFARALKNENIIIS